MFEDVAVFEPLHEDFQKVVLRQILWCPESPQKKKLTNHEEHVTSSSQRTGDIPGGYIPGQTVFILTARYIASRVRCTAYFASHGNSDRKSVV